MMLLAMMVSPQHKQRSGLSPKWANLPRRKCANCGKSYKPKRPLRSDEKYGFCKKQCKGEFHKHGGAYRKLKDEILKFVERRVLELEGQLREIVRDALQGSEPGQIVQPQK